MGKNILITGGTGLIGSKLFEVLLKAGYNVAVLSRNPNKTKLKAFYANYEKNEIDDEAILFSDIVINLTGENISKGRWSDKQKEKIVNSRVQSVVFLLKKFREKNKKLDSFISASAIGFYGSYTSDTIFTEETEGGDDFLAKTVKLWEKAVDKFEDVAERIVKLRIGVVLAKEGGAFPKLLKTVNYGMGSAVGTGKQYMPWIHIDDLTALFLYIVDNNKSKGVYNAVSPFHITNSEFMKSLAKSRKKPFFLPKIPAFILKIFLGEMSCIILEGSRVSSDKIQKIGFRFVHKELLITMSILV